MNMFIEPGFNIAGVSSKQERVRTHPHQPCHFALDVQVRMLAEERQARDGNLAIAEFFHFGDLNAIPESAILEQEFERWILKMPASIAWDNNVLHFMPDLQESLKQHVILMIMGDQHIIDLLRQVEIGIA